jgi:hypothetical protein
MARLESSHPRDTGDPYDLCRLLGHTPAAPDRIDERGAELHAAASPGTRVVMGQPKSADDPTSTASSETITRRCGDAGPPRAVHGLEYLAQRSPENGGPVSP